MANAFASEEAVQEIATQAVVRNAAVPCDASAAAVKGQLTLMIQPPTGNAVWLTYSADEGWRADNTTTVAKQVSERVAPVSAPQPAADSGLDEASRKPMTVFIDGPTGYTYFWSRERGWKFVGRLTERVQ